MEVLQMNLTSELISEAKAAKSVEELLTLAAEKGMSLTREEAETAFARLHQEAATGALSDEELENVSAGSSCKNGRTYSSDPPYYLITTAWNSCKSCTKGGKLADGYCKDCAWCIRSGLTLYCQFRKKGYDIYN